MKPKECCKTCDFKDCKVPCINWLKEYPEWLFTLSNEKLVSRLKTSVFNFTISTHVGQKPNYNEQNKVVMYENEILRRLNNKTQ